jgi:hypothetical protein
VLVPVRSYLGSTDRQLSRVECSFDDSRVWWDSSDDLPKNVVAFAFRYSPPSVCEFESSLIIFH